MKIEVSNGEIVDKLTILDIKLRLISDKGKLENVQTEFNELSPIVKSIYDDLNREDRERMEYLHNELQEVNQKLWYIEDDIRVLESQKDFGEEFIDLARSVYFTNDERAKLKKEINLLTGSLLVEEKSYEDYSSSC